MRAAVRKATVICPTSQLRRPNLYLLKKIRTKLKKGIYFQSQQVARLSFFRQIITLVAILKRLVLILNVFGLGKSYKEKEVVWLYY